jgi:hypothetical protein
MVLALAQRSRSQSVNRTAVRFPCDVRELVAFCPECRTPEAPWSNNGCLMQAPKCNLRGEELFMIGTQQSLAVCTGPAGLMLIAPVERMMTPAFAVLGWVCAWLLHWSGSCNEQG